MGVPQPRTPWVLSFMSETIAIPGYRIESKLGQGGMASVYLAVQEGFERRVALKVMVRELSSDPTFAARFMREARIVASLSHASIVTVFDVGEHGNYHYLSMEYLPAGDLKTRIQQGAGSARLALEVCVAVCAALDAAHRKGFVHRDIKPENILFREDGTPVLTDFGIARVADSDSALTVAGVLVGTPSYMSPEQVKGLELDGRSDLYSVGMVLYEILTGRAPFRSDSDSTFSVALRQVSEPLPPLPPEHGGFQAFLDRLTAKDPASRFATAADVIRELRQLPGGPAVLDTTLIRVPAAQDTLIGSTAQGLATRPSEPGPGQRAAVPARSWIVLAGAAGVVALAAGSMLVLTRTARTPVATVAQPTTTVPESAPASRPQGEEKQRVRENDDARKRLAEERLAQARRDREAKEARSLRERVVQVTAEKQQEQIEKLLGAAREYLAEGALWQPPGASTADRYRAVLHILPHQPEALAGARRLADVLAEEARRSQLVGDIFNATLLIAQIRSLQPANPRLPELQARLEEMQAKPRPPLDFAVHNRLQLAAGHIARAHEALGRTPLDSRAADEAITELDKAVAVEPMAPGLPSLRLQLAVACVNAVQTELSRHDTGRALTLIATARSRNWSNAELEMLEANILLVPPPAPAPTPASAQGHRAEVRGGP